MSNQEEQTFGSMLRWHRRSAGLTQEALAERAQLSARTISDLERGMKATPQAATLDLLVRGLELSPEDRDSFLSLVPRRRRGGGLPEMDVPAFPALPADLTPLVGRERDEATAIHLLGAPTTRLLTLVGPGGVGKTRLALRIAETLKLEFTEGVAFVSLAAISDPSQTAAAIAVVLGVKDTGSQSAPAAIASFLGKLHVLLVLDNFEHVSEAAPIVSELLTSCATLTILATSRGPLHVRGEHILDVPPLAIPSLTKNVTPREALGYSAIALFVQRARAVQPAFALSESDVKPVIEICRRLDGVPLALEIGAAQIRNMSPATLLERLARGVDALPPGPVDSPSRQRTIRHAIRWSYDLLDTGHQILFGRLSIFHGGWTLEAAESVLAETTGFDSDPLLEMLGALTDQSLVIVRATANEEPRFSMLETIRELSLEVLSSDAIGQRLNHRHAEFFLALAHRADESYREFGPTPFSRRLLAEHENLLSALRYLLNTSEASGALDLASCLVEYWIHWGFVREARNWMNLLLETQSVHETTSPAIMGRAYAGVARLAWIQNDYDIAAARYLDAIEQYRKVGDVKAEATTISNLGTVAHLRNRYDEASAYYEQAIEVARASNHIYGMALPMTNLGIIAMQRGEFERAAGLLDEGIALWRSIDQEQKLTVALGSRGNLAHRQKRYEEAAAIHAEVLDMKRAVGDQIGIAHSAGDLGLAKMELREYDEARALLGESMVIFYGAGHRDGVAQGLEAMARISRETGDTDRAARLYAGADALRQAIGVAHHPADLPQHQAELEILKSNMTATRFHRASEAGRAMTIDHLIDEAIGTAVPATHPA